MLYFSINEQMDLRKITNSVVALIKNHVAKNGVDEHFLTIDIKKIFHTIENENEKDKK